MAAPFRPLPLLLLLLTAFVLAPLCSAADSDSDLGASGHGDVGSFHPRAGVVASSPGLLHLRNCSAFVPPRDTDDGVPRVVCIPANAFKPRLTPHQKHGWTAAAIGVDQALRFTADLGNHTLPFHNGQTECWHVQSQHSVAALSYANLTVDLLDSVVVAGLRVAHCVGFAPITEHWLDVSVDGVTYSEPLAWGTWHDDGNTTGYHTAEFYPTLARYVRIRATLPAGGAVSLSDLHVLIHPDHNIANASASVGGRKLLSSSGSSNRHTLGSWGGTINLPLIPVSAAQLPAGQLLFWSAYMNTAFWTYGPGTTQTATLNVATLTSTARTVAYTAHEMFCPGSALLSDGRLLVMGGSNDAATSMYHYDTASWSQGRQLKIPRAYQSAVTSSDGSVFMVGGSFLGGLGGKYGERWSPVNATWTALPGAPADPIYTADPSGVYRSDNHAWLFARSNGWVFHAGPSKQMNWYYAGGQGRTISAGVRADSDDTMNGNAIMYDAVQGLILTLGGATAYDQTYGTFTSTARTYIVNIGTGTSTRPVVHRSGDLTYARSMCNSVVLPDGSVLVVGGQLQPEPFSDYTAVYAAELWNPATGRWTTLASAAIPRNYHSVAVLLADGTVFSGGGGLCGDCSTNHLDGQVFSPPYLFNVDGSRRTRPVIVSAPATVAPGRSITVLVSSTAAGVSAFSLVRFESTTHAQHTDQRRVPLHMAASAKPTTDHTHSAYTVQIPADTGVVVPGWYYLFALDSAGTPSVAVDINVAPVVAPAAVLPTATSTGTLQWNGQQYCLDWMWLGANGNRWVALWQCNGGDNQQWQFDFTDQTIRPPLDLSLCLTVDAANATDNAPLVLAPCLPAPEPSQSWLYDSSNQHWMVMGRCMDLYGGAVNGPSDPQPPPTSQVGWYGEGAGRVETWTCDTTNTNSNQFWTMASASS